jgi:mannose-6-phosphate isomerase-like protein (cupin superfamily)
MSNTGASLLRLPLLSKDRLSDAVVRERLDLSRILRPSDTFAAAKLTVAAGGHSNVDRHVDQELWIVLEGEGVGTIGGQVVSLKSGDTINVDPLLSHSIINQADTPLIILSFWWKPRQTMTQRRTGGPEESPAGIRITCADVR